MELDKLIKQGFIDEEHNQYTPPETYEHMWNVIEDRIQTRKLTSWREPLFRSLLRYVPVTAAVAAMVILFSFGKAVFYPSHVYEDTKEKAPIYSSAGEDPVNDLSEGKVTEPVGKDTKGETLNEYQQVFPSYIPEGFQLARKTVNFGTYITMANKERFVFIHIMPGAFSLKDLQRQYKGMAVALDNGNAAFLSAQYAQDNQRIASGKLRFNLADTRVEMSVGNMPEAEVLKIAGALEMMDMELQNDELDTNAYELLYQDETPDGDLIGKAMAYPSFQRAVDYSKEPPMLDEVLADFLEAGIPYEILRANNAPVNTDWEGRVIAAGARQGILFLMVQDRKAPRRSTEELIDARLEQMGIKTGP